MDSVAVLATLGLAIIFAVAGVAKLFDLRGTRQVVYDFGVPLRLMRPVALLLPLAEIAVAAALIIHPTNRWGAAAALTLLLLFLAGVANALRQGKDVDCGCFGRVYSATASTLTLVRNAVLAAFALVVLVQGGPPIDDWVAGRTAAELAAILLGVAAVALTVTAVLMRRSLSRTRERLDESERELADARAAVMAKPDGLPVGVIAPSFSLPDSRGGTTTLASLLARGRPVVMAFTSPTCGPSNKTIPHLARWQTALAERVTLAIIAGGTREANDYRWKGHEDTLLLFDGDEAVADAFNILATPVAVAIHPDGRVAGVAFGGLNGVEVVIRLALRSAYSAPDRQQEPAALPIFRVEPRTA